MNLKETIDSIEWSRFWQGSFFKILSIFLLVTLISVSSPAQSNFEKGITAYKEKKFTEAQTFLNDALEERPDNLAILNNLALTNYELNQKGKALAYWLKALKLDPGFEEATQGVAYVRSKLSSNSFSTKDTDFESIRKSLLKDLSLNFLFAITALTFLVAGLQWIKYLSSVKTSSNEDLPATPITIISIIFSVLFFMSTITLSLKIWDHLTPRAIVIKEKVELKMAPGADQSKIVELNEGSEVEIGIIKNEWVQVKIPGNYSGWLNKEDIQIIL